MQFVWFARGIVYMSRDSKRTANSSNFNSEKEVWEDGYDC